MKKVRLHYWFLLLVLFPMIVNGQNRRELTVPNIDTAATITIDGKMDETDWTNAARIDLVSSTGYDMWMNNYYREALVEPEFDEYNVRLLWKQDTLFLFIHIDEFVNDTTNLFWDGQWAGDQLFVSLSSRLGLDYQGWYDGNVYAAPQGPYHYLILGDQIYLNMDDTTFVPEEWRNCVDDSLMLPQASKYARMATAIDTLTGKWDLELAIYQPNIADRSRLGFNIGGSIGSRYAQETYGDAYAYYTWLPNVPDDPLNGDPVGEGKDPGAYNLATSSHFGILKFEDSQAGYVRKVVEVPEIDTSSISIDGVMNESQWTNARKIDLVSSSGYEMWMNNYYRESLVEPEFDEYNVRLAWSRDTLYMFLHMDEFVNDSTNLFWDGQWAGDQLFISVSNQMGRDMNGWYDGNAYAAPDGPYQFLILGDQLSINSDPDTLWIPEEWRKCFNGADSVKIGVKGTDFARFATKIDTLTGVWDVEMAIPNTAIAPQGNLGFNVGGSIGSRQAQETYGDAYAYYTWQPSIPDQPLVGDPVGESLDPGAYNLMTSKYFASLVFTGGLTSVGDNNNGSVPSGYSLYQNYPNPFNPATTIRFSIPNNGKVSLKIYNVVGEEVATLVNRFMNAGSYETSFNASKLSSGVYFYELRTNDFQQTKKMILVK